MILVQNAPAKLNLGLHVLQKRPDGYHDLETVFLPIAWHDTLQVEVQDTWTFTCSDPQLPTDESNLCVKAAQRLREVSGVSSGAALHLEKLLPYGAGLGGGSSDAAHTLRLLNTLWDAGVSKAALHTIAAELGSDVAFFLEDQAMYATGRGELLEPLQDETGQPYQFPFYIVVVVPPVHVHTAVAYSGITPNNINRPDLRSLVLSNDLSRWQAHLVNDFEASVFARYPVIRDVKATLQSAGAGYASMSGSGSAVFGVFEDKATADQAARSFDGENMRVWCS